VELTARDRLATLLGPELLDALDAHVGELVAEASAHANGAAGWLDRKAAAAYLGVPVSRLEKARDVPSHRWEGRVLYSRAELDEWMQAQ
jgi:hypothetical protein